MLVMQNQTNTETVRIALQTNWGGSIVEFSLNGTNFVNEHDTGREIQMGLWDNGNLPCPCWNPTQGGDEYDNGTPTIAQTVTSDSLYTKAQALQWYPDLYGGGPTQPIASDIMMEQTVTPVPISNRAFHLHYKIAHLGTDLHTNAWQQIPVVYINDGVNQLVYYAGAAPWTNSGTTQTEITNQTPNLYAPERWGSLVDVQNQGVTLYVPAAYPWAYGAYFPNGGSGPTGNTTVEFAPVVTMTFTPNLIVESDAYVIVGDPQTARRVIYDLHQSFEESNVFTPFGSLDAPASNAVLSGMTTVSGWALAVDSVAKVEVLVDGTVDGLATYGLSRPDIPVVYPNAPVNVGFTDSLDSSKYSNGAHILNIRVTDSSGNIGIFANRNITISN